MTPGSPIPTVADREAELAALQTAFDEYIASSRELEDELDAELAKMQEKLAESSTANAALVAQLENVTPQLSSLERALSDVKSKLEQESNARRKSELAQDEAEARAREAEGSLAALQGENGEALEQLAFRDEEVEELKLELEVEKERNRAELEDMGSELEAAKAKIAKLEKSAQTPNGNSHQNPEDGTAATEESTKDGDIDASVETNRSKSQNDPASVGNDYDRPHGDDDIGSEYGVAGDENDEYIRSLEDELEDVTEQLIDAETRLSEMEAKLADAERLKEESDMKVSTLEEKLNEADENGEVRNSSEGKSNEENDEKDERDATILQLKEGNHQYKEKVDELREEIVLVNEELAMTRGELKALEEDSRLKAESFEKTKSEHKEAIATMSGELEKSRAEVKSSKREIEALHEAVKDANLDRTSVREELTLLNAALENSKKDHSNVSEEMDVLKSAFDAAQKVNKENERNKTSMRQLLEAKEKDLGTLKDDVDKLKSSNSLLNKALERTEKEKNAPAKTGSSEGAVATLEAELVNTKDQLEMQVEETTKLRSELENLRRKKEELAQTKANLEKTKKQLSETKEQLAQIGARNESLLAFNPSLLPSKSSQSGMSNKEIEESASSTFYMSHARSRSRTPHTSTYRARSCSPTTMQRLEQDVTDKSCEAQKLVKTCESLKDQQRMNEKKIRSLEEELREKQRNVSSKKQEDVPSKAEVVPVPVSSPLTVPDQRDEVDEEEFSNVEEIIRSSDNDRIATEFRSLAKKSSQMREHNAGLLQRILSLQGNIQVCCRVRPMKTSEMEAGMRSVVESLSETEVGCFDSRTKKWKSYAFDKVWGPDSSQRGVFQDVEPLALSVVDGYNTCIFAYGQTGSGKTYTMEGLEGHQQGISHRTIKKLFTLLDFRARQHVAAASQTKQLGNDEDNNSTFSFSINVSMLEIYNDEVYDLLTPVPPGKKKPSLDVRRGEEGLIEVPLLTKEKVNSLQDVMDLLKRGNQNRATATTNLNEHSSRSHMILNVKVTLSIDGQPASTGNLYLVDLAGSERVRKSAVEGKELKEAGHINKSLSALGNVMEALDRKASHVPYRDSKLTYLLQDSLGGNSRTMMVVAVCPTDDSYDETQNALQFATRVRRINLGAAQRNVASKNLEEAVKNLTAEMKMLAKAKERTEEQLLALKRENARIQERLSLASASRTKNQDEARTLAALRKNSTEMTARWQKEKVLRDEKSADLDNCQKELKRVQQQFIKLTNDHDMLTRKLSEKEQAHADLSQQLRTVKDDASAAKLRARKAEMLLSRNSAQVAAGAPSKTTRARPIRTASKSADTTRKARKENSTTEESTSVDSSETPKEDAEVEQVREKVLSMLKRYDPAKVDKIDTIMSTFKGRESDLLQKMTARYEGDSQSVSSFGSGRSSGSRTAMSAKQRSEVAMAKHKERMAKMRERRTQSAGGS